MTPLGGIPDWFLSSVIGFDEGANFHDQQLQEMRTRHPQQLYDNRCINQGPSSSTNCGIIPRSVEYSSLLAAELEKQRQEIDWLLQVENQRLRMILQEKSRQHGALFRKYERKVMELMSQKDKDLEIARRRSLELQSFLTRAQEENEALKKKAMESEAVVLDLNSKLELVIAGNLKEALEAESYCESSSSNGEEEQQQLKKKMSFFCKQCEKRSLMNVVFLPCQHLCCCTTCEPLAPLCPVCQTVKAGSLEVFFD